MSNEKNAEQDDSTLPRTVELLDLLAKEIVTAEVVPALSLSKLNAVESEWREYRIAAKARSWAAGVLGPPSADWDWTEKFFDVDIDSALIYGLQVSKQFQGLAMVSQIPSAAISRPQNLLYVECIESAPWNLQAYVADAARFGLVGTALLRCAVAYSFASGCGGSLGLHSLKEAEDFYRKRGFVDLGLDEAEGLHYFELLPDAAGRLLSGDHEWNCQNSAERRSSG